MAKATLPGDKAAAKKSYPSAYGSHASMINQEATDKLCDKSLVICQDDNGLYETYRNRLDTGFADPRRSDQDFRMQMSQERPELFWKE
jgi:hypothetical protein